MIRPAALAAPVSANRNRMQRSCEAGSLSVLYVKVVVLTSPRQLRTSVPLQDSGFYLPQAFRRSNTDVPLQESRWRVDGSDPMMMIDALMRCPARRMTTSNTALVNVFG